MSKRWKFIVFLHKNVPFSKLTDEKNFFQNDVIPFVDPFLSKHIPGCSQRVPRYFRRDIAASFWTEATIWKLNSVTADETFFLYDFVTYERKYYFY